MDHYRSIPVAYRFLTLVLASLVLFPQVGPPFGGMASAQEKGRPRKPNIVILLADDMGYADVGFQGCKDIPTPNIDALAQGGVRCTSGYVSGPYCSPTRAGLLTGRYQTRFGHEFNPGGKETGNIGLPLSETTIADRLKSAGYATGLVGKWHLGSAAKFHPQKRGFRRVLRIPGRSAHLLRRQGQGRRHPPWHRARRGEGISDRRFRPGSGRLH